MKKYLSALLSLALILSLSGCGGNKETATDSLGADTQAETTVTVTESETVLTTEAAMTSEETVTEEQTSETTVSEETSNDTEEASSRMTALVKRIAEWTDGNVIMHVSLEDEGVATNIDLNTYDQKLYMLFDISGYLNNVTIYDGEYTYTLDRDSLTYMKEAAKNVDSSTIDELLIDEKTAENSINSGTETINGEEYFFEEYDYEDEDGSIRYYFDKDGNIKYAGTSGDSEEDNILMVFEVYFLDAPDTTVFEIPSDYKEISSEEFAVALMAKMFGALSDATE